MLDGEIASVQYKMPWKVFEKVNTDEKRIRRKFEPKIKAGIKTEKELKEALVLI